MPQRLALADFRVTTPNLIKADELLKEAKRFLKRAGDQLLSDHAESVARSSRTIELSAKALLTLAGFTFPMRHDVGVGLAHVWRSLHGEDLEKVQLAKRHIARVGWLCDVVERLQSISEYGYAEKRASLVVNQTDAFVFYEYGRESLDIACRVYRGVKNGIFKVKHPG